MSLTGQGPRKRVHVNKSGKKPYLFGKAATSAKPMPKGKGAAKGKGKGCK